MPVLGVVRGEGTSVATTGALDPLDPLVAPAAAGDRRALEELLAGLAPIVLRVVRATLGSMPSAAEDVVQETLLAVWRTLPNFRGDSSISCYAVGIAVRRALTARTKRSRREELFPSACAPSEPPTEAGEDSPYVGSVGGSPEEEALWKRQREAFREVLERLPAPQAEAIALRVILGYSVPEIAAATDVPLNTVRSRLGHARKALHARLEKQPDLREALETIL